MMIVLFLLQLEKQNFKKRYKTLRVVTLSTQGNVKLLQQLKSGFKRPTNWNKFQRKVSTEG